MNDNIILDPAEREYKDLVENIQFSIEMTKHAIKAQEDIARKADAAVVRLEAQLYKLQSFKA
tara:strand:- start:4372 stop:4557 length:186 start_codon:yes stop_codon:yes gene_type:complete